MGYRGEISVFEHLSGCWFRPRSQMGAGLVLFGVWRVLVEPVVLSPLLSWGLTLSEDSFSGRLTAFYFYCFWFGTANSPKLPKPTSGRG